MAEMEAASTGTAQLSLLPLLDWMTRDKYKSSKQKQKQKQKMIHRVPACPCLRFYGELNI